jgi:biopolymer transport protein ExbB/TolQ
MQSAELGRNVPKLATIASVAPYIGLFGTVLGILDAFGHIAATGQTGAKVVAGPISEALVATALGLGVAIPAVMAYNYFSGRVNSLSQLVEDHALELTARLPQLGIGAELAEEGAAGAVAPAAVRGLA